ncbi:hypothetical protein ULMS_00290 [Patiriisocius marinistellae]|uniref:Uncharacterized protein n=1 Tax=Patiriisocius marinistellae TaxID=2494560 RepID=A0A5J4FXX3_9FLAO|nr:hypothetical protein [Patiriisocius marinistellae]GEQ84521.1 hypothetical protein ULMS_00290 [Patiriisocius marinistellae]
MKILRPFFTVLFLLVVSAVFAQKQYTIDGKQYKLNTEAEGTITLLWNTIEGEYRFFSQKGTAITELTNTYSNGDYNEEYKVVLQQQTGWDASRVKDTKLTLGSLRNFFNSYNAGEDTNYSYNEPIKLQHRLGAFVGVNNAAYTANPTNASHTALGIEYEVLDPNKLKRHSLVFRFKQTLDADDHAYSASQVSFNYRFKFIKSETLDLFANIKVAEYSYIKNERTVITPVAGNPGESTTVIVDTSGGTIDAIGGLGLGADYKLGNGYLTLSLNDLVAVGLEKNDEFPLDVTLGYKFIF